MGESTQDWGQKLSNRIINSEKELAFVAARKLSLLDPQLLWECFTAISISHCGMSCPFAPLLVENHKLLWNTLLEENMQLEAELLLNYTVAFFVECPKSSFVSDMTLICLNAPATCKTITDLYFRSSNISRLDEFAQEAVDKYNLSSELLGYLRDLLDTCLPLYYLIIQLIKILCKANPKSESDVEQLQKITTIVVTIFQWCRILTPSLEPETLGHTILILVFKLIAETFLPPVLSSMGHIDNPQSSLIGQIVHRVVENSNFPLLPVLVFCVNITYLINIRSETVIYHVPSFFKSPSDIGLEIDNSLLKPCSVMLNHFIDFAQQLPVLNSKRKHYNDEYVFIPYQVLYTSSMKLALWNAQHRPAATKSLCILNTTFDTFKECITSLQSILFS